MYATIMAYKWRKALLTALTPLSHNRFLVAPAAATAPVPCPLAAAAVAAATAVDLSEERANTIFTFADHMIQGVMSHKVDNATSHVNVKDGGMYILYFANCEHQMPVSFDLRVETFNLVGPNERKDYLSIGEAELHIMYWVRL